MFAGGWVPPLILVRPSCGSRVFPGTGRAFAHRPVLGSSEDKIRFLEPWLICRLRSSSTNNCITTVAHALTWVGLGAGVWTAVDGALGTVPRLRILGNILPDLRMAIDLAPRRGRRWQRRRHWVRSFPARKG